MTDRIVDLSDAPASLNVRNGLIVIHVEGSEPHTIPPGDLAALVVSHGHVQFTQAVLASLAQAGAAFVVCDARHMPAAMLLPIEGHYVQAERFARQASAPKPTCKRLWKHIVRTKIAAQASLVRAIEGTDGGIAELISEVRSGDPANVESQAARKYWPHVFGPDFRRDHEREDINRNLNYGYAVVRAITARAVCAVGLHPSLGLHHKNRYNSFALADDLMEPLRPLVDRAVHAWSLTHGRDAPLDHEAKAAILMPLLDKFRFDDEHRTLFDIVSRMASSLVAVLEGRREKMLMANLLEADS